MGRLGAHSAMGRPLIALITQMGGTLEDRRVLSASGKKALMAAIAPAKNSISARA